MKFHLKYLCILAMFPVFMYLAFVSVSDLMVCKRSSSVPTGNTRMEYVDGNKIKEERLYKDSYECKYHDTIYKSSWKEEK